MRATADEEGQKTFDPHGRDSSTRPGEKPRSTRIDIGPLLRGGGPRRKTSWIIRSDDATCASSADCSTFKNMDIHSGIDVEALRQLVSAALSRIPDDARVVLTKAAVPVYRNGEVIGQIQIESDSMVYFPGKEARKAS